MGRALWGGLEPGCLGSSPGRGACWDIKLGGEGPQGSVPLLWGVVFPVCAVLSAPPSPNPFEPPQAKRSPLFAPPPSCRGGGQAPPVPGEGETGLLGSPLALWKGTGAPNG